MVGYLQHQRLRPFEVALYCFDFMLMCTPPMTSHCISKVWPDYCSNGSAPGTASAVDTVVTTIGIRSAVWTPTAGFQLNGIKTPVQGFSNHQSWSGCGNAVPERVDEFRITVRVGNLFLERRGGHGLGGRRGLSYFD